MEATFSTGVSIKRRIIVGGVQLEVPDSKDLGSTLLQWIDEFLGFTEGRHTSYFRFTEKNRDLWEVLTGGKDVGISKIKERPDRSKK